MNRSLFIVIEGPNGSGKTTLINSIASELATSSIKHLLTKEPTNTELGSFIRATQNDYSKETLACLVAANRYEHISTFILPNLENGISVISDRYFPSSLVYQRMDGLDIEFIMNLNQKILKPDLTVFLTTGENTLKERIEARDQTTRFEKNQLNEINLYSEAQSIVNNLGWKTLSVASESTPVEALTKKILDELQWS